MKHAMDTTIIEQFAEFAHRTQIDDIPERVINKVKLQIINIITASKFSDWHADALKVYAAEKKRNTSPADATVIALKKKLSAEEAAVVNAAFSMTLDFDCYMLMGHMDHSSVFTPLAFLESANGTLNDLILSTVVCNEIMARLSFSCFLGPLNGQTWSYIHALGAATAVAKVMKFDKEKTASAMAIALYQPPFCLLPGFWNEGTKLLTASIPIRSGIKAAFYADQGLEGPLTILEDHLGFMHFFSFHPVKELVEHLGKVWLTDTIGYKRYPGTSYIGAPVDSALGAMHDCGLSAVTDINGIKKIEVDTTLLTHSLESVSSLYASRRPSVDAIAINFSARLSIAYALLRGDLKPEFFKEKEIKRYEKAILQLADMITVRHDFRMSAKTVLAFPNTLHVLKNLKPHEKRMIREHFKSMRGGSAAMSVGEILKGLGQILFDSSGRQLIKQFLTPSKKEMNLPDLNLAEFPMLQSARTKITLTNGKSGYSDFPIPYGGSGRGPDEQKDWVKKRYELAFKKDPKRIFNLLDDLDTPVRKFIRELY